MPALNGGTGNIIALKQPRLSSSTASNMGYSQSASKILVSCNSPMVCQVQWGQTISRVTNLMTDDSYLSGDLVNVIYDIYIGNDYSSSYMNTSGNMTLAGSLRKSRDLPYTANLGIDPNWGQGNLDVDYHTFTADIAPVVKNYLTYTLTPLLKGSPSSEFQMSGTYATNDFLDFTSVQGSYIYVDIVARFEVYEQDAVISKRLVIANNGNVETKDLSSTTVINSAPQQYDKPVTNDYWITCGSATTSKKFLTNKPNENFGGKGISGYSSVRMDDEGEFLSWFQYRFANDDTPNYAYDMTDYYVRITTEAGATVNLRYFQETMGNTIAPSSAFWTGVWNETYANRVLSQNVSPAFIETHAAGTITAADTWYSARLVCSGTTLGSGQTVSEARYYKIDREPDNIPYGFVRFHWLNRMGGIDSYTAKRNVTESVNSNKVFFERKSPNPNFTQQYDGLEYTTSRDPMGNDTYK